MLKRSGETGIICKDTRRKISEEEEFSEAGASVRKATVTE